MVEMQTVYTMGAVRTVPDCCVFLHVYVMHRKTCWVHAMQEMSPINNKAQALQLAKVFKNIYCRNFSVLISFN